jgi:hypothetical protein
MKNRKRRGGTGSRRIVMGAPAELGLNGFIRQGRGLPGLLSILIFFSSVSTAGGFVSTAD